MFYSSQMITTLKNTIRNFEIKNSTHKQQNSLKHKENQEQERFAKRIVLPA